jgi:hypothetical protein
VSSETSTAVIVWWVGLSAISAVNIARWWLARRELQAMPSSSELAREQRRMLILAGAFTFVCAFRSFLPRADVQRICLVDSWFSTVLVGRFVATIAELAFVAQVAAALRGAARHLGAPAIASLARAIVPAIAVAECCSWYAVITTNFVGNALEQSIWAAMSLVAGTCAVILSARAAGPLRRFLRVSAVLAFAHVVFEATVDVPMYVTRYLDDRSAGKVYAGLRDGLDDLATRWVVTFRWEEWHAELAWMAFYFSVAVWMSLALVRAPRLWQAR